MLQQFAHTNHTDQTPCKKRKYTNEECTISATSTVEPNAGCTVRTVDSKRYKKSSIPYKGSKFQKNVKSTSSYSLLIVDTSSPKRQEDNYGVKSYTKKTAQAHISEAMNCGYLGLQSKTKLNNTFESKFVEVDNDQCFGVNILNNQTLPQDAVLQVMTNNGVSYAILLRPPLAIFDGWSESQIGTARKNAEKSSTSTDDNGLKNVALVAGRLSLFNGSGRQSRLPESRVMQMSLFVELTTRLLEKVPAKSKTKGGITPMSVIAVAHDLQNVKDRVSKSSVDMQEQLTIQYVQPKRNALINALAALISEDTSLLDQVQAKIIIAQDIITAAYGASFDTGLPGPSNATADTGMADSLKGKLITLKDRAINMSHVLSGNRCDPVEMVCEKISNGSAFAVFLESIEVSQKMLIEAINDRQLLVQSSSRHFLQDKTKKLLKCLLLLAASCKNADHSCSNATSMVSFKQSWLSDITLALANVHKEITKSLNSVQIRFDRVAPKVIKDKWNKEVFPSLVKFVNSNFPSNPTELTKIFQAINVVPGQMSLKSWHDNDKQVKLLRESPLKWLYLVYTEITASPTTNGFLNTLYDTNMGVALVQAFLGWASRSFQRLKDETRLETPNMPSGNVTSRSSNSQQFEHCLVGTPLEDLVSGLSEIVRMEFPWNTETNDWKYSLSPLARAACARMYSEIGTWKINQFTGMRAGNAGMIQILTQEEYDALAPAHHSGMELRVGVFIVTHAIGEDKLGKVDLIYRCSKNNSQKKSTTSVGSEKKWQICHQFGTNKVWDEPRFEEWLPQFYACYLVTTGDLPRKFVVNIREATQDNKFEVLTAHNFPTAAGKRISKAFIDVQQTDQQERKEYKEFMTERTDGLKWTTGKLTAKKLSSYNKKGVSVCNFPPVGREQDPTLAKKNTSGSMSIWCERMMQDHCKDWSDERNLNLKTVTQFKGRTKTSYCYKLDWIPKEPPGRNAKRPRGESKVDITSKSTYQFDRGSLKKLKRKWSPEKFSSFILSAKAVAEDKLLISFQFAGRQHNVSKFYGARDLLISLGIGSTSPIVAGMMITNTIEPLQEAEAHKTLKIIEDHYCKMLSLSLANPTTNLEHLVNRLWSHPNTKPVISLSGIEKWPETLVEIVGETSSDVATRMDQFCRLTEQEQVQQLFCFSCVKTLLEWIIKNQAELRTHANNAKLFEFFEKIKNGPATSVASPKRSLRTNKGNRK